MSSSDHDAVHTELKECISSCRSTENANRRNASDVFGSEPRDENMNEWLHGSHFSVQSAPIADSARELELLSSKRSLPIAGEQLDAADSRSDILPLPASRTDEESSKVESMEIADSVKSLVRPCSLVLPSSAGATLNLTAVANEAQLRHCPILVKDLSYDTVDDEDNENHMTISSLTARPLIAKSHELRTKKIARKLREAERRARVRRFKPPDGGYGWAVVVGAFLVQFWVSGLVKSYGVLFVEVMEAFTDTSTVVAAWIPAILSTLCLALGKFLFSKQT